MTGQVGLKFNPGADPSKTVDIADNVAYARVSRYAARKRRWRAYNQVLGLNWKPNEVEPVFGVWGEQLKYGGLKIEGKVKLETGWGWSTKKGWSASDKGGLEISFKQEYKDKVLSSLSYEREQFFIENWRDADRKGVYEGLAIRQAGAGKRSTVWYTYDIDAYNN